MVDLHGLILCAGYVEQFDTLLPELTVTEMLMYTAELKRKRKEPLTVRPPVTALILILAHILNLTLP